MGKPLFCSPPSVLSPDSVKRPAVAGGCPKGSLHVANNNMPPSDEGVATKECFPGTWSAFVSHAPPCPLNSSKTRRYV